MTNKILISLVMTLALAVAQVSVAFAQEVVPISGTVNDIVLEIDATTGETTVLVTLQDGTGATQTVRLSVETAADPSLGLVTIDPTTGVVTVNESAKNTTINIDPTTVIPDTSPSEEEAQHPVGSALSDFFSELLGVDYDTIMGYHEDGVGFGVIAQALWMTNQLEGDTAIFQMILDAKESGDYSVVILPDGSTPTNWGQFKKAVMGTGKKDNLGTVMSGNAEDTTVTTTQENPNITTHPGNKDKSKDKSNNGRGHNR
jgi:hypothetical protein